MTDITKSDYIVGQCAKNASFTIHIEGAAETDRILVKNIIKQLELYIEMLPMPEVAIRTTTAFDVKTVVYDPYPFLPNKGETIPGKTSYK